MTSRRRVTSILMQRDESRRRPASRRAPAQHGATPFRRPVQLLAFGFGSGSSPGARHSWAPWPQFPVLADRRLGTGLVHPFVLAAAVAGIWICGRRQRTAPGARPSRHSVGRIVGYWITLWAMPVDWGGCWRDSWRSGVRHRQTLADQPPGQDRERGFGIMIGRYPGGA